jgi:hypothetical protein
VAKYAGKLAAVDVFTIDNAFAMLKAQRIDAGVLGPFGIQPWVLRQPPHTRTGFEPDALQGAHR